MTFGYGDRWWENKPADLEKTDAASAAKAASTSKDSYTTTIKMSLVKGKTYKFWFKYKYENPETKEVTLSDSSPIWKETFAIPNLTKGVLNLVLTAGYKNYGVKFDIDPTSVQEDIVIYESLTSTSLGNEVYRGTSTNVTIPTNSIATRWITVRTRDKWDDLNKTDTGPLPVTPLNPDPDTTYTVDNPATASASASIDPKDLSGFSLVSTITWAQSINPKTAGYAIRWSTNNPDTAGVTPLWEYASVSGINTLSFTATGLIPNTTYYYQVAGVTPYDVVDWTGITTRTFIASDADGTAAGALARLKSFIAIGGASQDLFKIGTGISQSINLNTDPLVTPTLTAGTYHGIILNKSTTNVGNNFWLTTGQFRVGNPTEFMYWNGTNLYLTGNINATGGNFTGNVRLNGGTLFAGALPDSGQRVRLNSSGVFAYNSAGAQTFSLDTAGYINATTGLIGGWNLGATTLSNNGVVLDSANGQISVGSAPSNSVYLSSTGSFRIWAGAQVPTDAAAKFKIGSDGTLYATGAVIGLGAGSTGPFATTDALNSYTLTSVTTGINSRLQNVEGAYVTVSTLNSSVATKNTTFVTTDSTQPYANKAGDLWINGGDNNSIWTANGAGQNWTEKTNGKYATVTSLNSKLSAGGYAIAAQDGQITNITSNGIFITPGTFKISNTNESAPYSGSYLLLNSAGMTAYDGSKTTFAISSSGSATFSGAISASSFDGGTITIGVNEGSSGYINTSSTKYGVTTMVIKAIGHASTSTSGWTTSCYPWDNGTFSLGTDQYSWNNLYLAGGAYFADGSTIKIDANGYATFNRISLTGGYGVYTDWSPGPDSTYSLGISSRRWQDVWAIDSSINSSDIRLKRDIQESNLGLSFINRLKPISYKWKESKHKPVLEEKIEIIDTNREDKREQVVMMPKIIGYDENGGEIIETTAEEGLRNHYGFIAQEVKEALDLEGVGDSFAGWVLDDHLDPESRQNLRYSEFISPLTKAVQELSDMVESLQQEINTLKGI